MRILVISDIHANLSALDAVITAAGDFDTTWCLGDLVGYGPDPNECVARIRQLPNLHCIIGNHDAAVLMQIDADTFNPEARSALLWTRKTISEDVRQFLQGLPERIVIEDLGVTLVHGSPRHPVWEYLLDWRSGGYGFRYVHHFQEDELSQVAEEHGFRVKETFYSDGEGGRLSLYQIWEK